MKDFEDFLATEHGLEIIYKEPVEASKEACIEFLMEKFEETIEYLWGGGGEPGTAIFPALFDAFDED